MGGSKHVGEPGFGIDVVELGGRDQQLQLFDYRLGATCPCPDLSKIA
jgi:hypothetical protein